MNKVGNEKNNFSKISNTVIIFKMNKELNDNENISTIQDTYFEQFLKVDGRYLVPGKNKKPNFAENGINEDDTIIFIYQDMLIATAKIKKDKAGKYCFEVSETEKRNWPYEISKEEWQIFKYYFCFKDVKKLPPIYFKSIEELFTEPFAKSQTAIFHKELKEDAKEKFINLIHFENQKQKNFDLIHENTWQGLIKRVKKPSLLKEINLYSYENIHTSFLCNFVNLNNIYGLKDKPLKEFMKYLKTQAQGKNKKRLAKIDLAKAKVEVKSQYNFKIEKGKIIPDITIIFEDKIYLIIEAKVCALENIYEDEQKQCAIYYDNLEKDSTKECIYIFLTMRKHKEEENKEYIKITFKDIYENIYKKFLNIKIGSDILHEYLKSFHYLCDNEKYNFTIDEIPAYYLVAPEKLKKSGIYEKLMEDVEEIVNYKIPSNIPKEDLLYYRYLLVLLYNMEKKKGTKEKLKICYDNLVGYK